MHQNGLGLIIGVVAHGNGIGAGICGHIGQEAITRLTGGFLQRQASLTRQLGHIRSTDSARHSEASSEPSHKIGVGVGLRATQPVIEMHDVQPQPHLRRQTAQQMQQT